MQYVLKYIVDTGRVVGLKFDILSTWKRIDGHGIHCQVAKLTASLQ